MPAAPVEPADEVPATAIRQRLDRGARVRRHSEYRFIQLRGRRVHSAHYVWIVMPRLSPAISDSPRAPVLIDGARLGITITKKTAQRAVARNRVKRVVREVFRRERALFPVGCDVVVVAKTGAELLGYAEVLAELQAVTAKLASAARNAPRGNEGQRRNA